MRQAKPSKARSKGKQRRSPTAEQPSTEAASAEEALDLHQRPTTAPPRSGVRHTIPVFEPSRVPRISLKTGQNTWLEGNPTCVELTAALLADGLVHSDAPRCSCAGCSHRVALAIKPAQETSPSDFHLYRQDRDGWWSHKEGGGAVTNLDESGNRIKDPETADRGKYTVFCGFFCVPKVKVEIL